MLDISRREVWGFVSGTDHDWTPWPLERTYGEIGYKLNREFSLRTLWNVSTTSFNKDYKVWGKEEKILHKTQYWLRPAISRTTVPFLTRTLDVKAEAGGQW